MLPVLIYNKHFLQFDNLISVVTTKISGNNVCNIPYSFKVKGNNDLEFRNKEILFNKLSICETNTVFEEQVHSDNISFVQNGCLLNDNDGLITDVKGLYLFTTIADCIPIQIYDKKNNIIAALHSGWRGTLKNILKKCLIMLFSQYNSMPEDIYIYQGPSICKNCFEVDSDVADLFSSEFIRKKNNKWTVDLKSYNNRIIKDFSISDLNVFNSKLCTYSQKNLLHSYRRDKTLSGRMYSIIALK